MYKYYSMNNNIKICLFEFSGKTSNDDFNLFKIDFDKLLNRKKSFVAIFNLIGVESFNINFRKLNP